MFYYRPQRSWAKVMFLQASVIMSTDRGCLPQCMLGYPPRADTPPRADPPRSRHTPEQTHPPEQTPPWSRHLPRHPPEQTPSGADTSQADTPQSRHPPASRHPSPEQTPPWEADSSIRSTSGQYASYWNAFLFGHAMIIMLSCFDTDFTSEVKANKLLIIHCFGDKCKRHRF